MSCDREQVSKKFATPKGGNIYPLTFLQEGILFESLNDDLNDDYLVQMSCLLRGIDLPRWRLAWDTVVDHVDVLRTAFAWRNVSPPLQVVGDGVKSQWAVIPIEASGDVSQNIVFNAFIEHDRTVPFNLSRAPLHRMATQEAGHGVFRFVWTYHHSILDAWSANLVMGWVLDAYLTGRIPRPEPFRLYVRWLQKQSVTEARRYWTKTFSQPRAANTLALRPGSAAGARSCRLVRHLPPAATAKLVSNAKRWRITTATIVQAAWALTLRDLSDAEDVTFGWVVSDRPAALSNSDSIVGLMVSTVPRRVDCGRDEVVETFLQAVQVNSGDAWENSRLPLTEIHEVAGLKGGQALFDTLVVFENLPQLASDSAGIAVYERRAHWRTSYPVSLMVAPGPSLKAEIVYQEARIEAAAVAAMLTRVEAYLIALAERPDARLGSLFVAEEPPPSWCGPTRLVCGDDFVDELFASLIRREHSVCLELPATLESFSGAEIARRATRLAQKLAALGLCRGVLVATHVDRDASQIIALLALLKLGCPFVVIDPCLPTERRRYMVVDSGARLILCRAGDDFGEDCDVRVAHLSSSGELSQVAPLMVLGDALPGAPAYLIYTSGSTGRPKGVVVARAALANLLTSMVLRPGLNCDDRLLALTTLSFDIALLEILGPLLAGATLILGPAGTGGDGARLASLIEQTSPTLLQGTPSVWRVLLESGWTGNGSLRAWCGGEPLERSLANRLLEHVARLWNLYGPTEATIWALVAEVVKGDAPISLGTPIDNMTVSVVDGRGNTVPPGGRGELILCGEGIATGYHNCDPAAQSAFALDAVTGARSYRTGDYVRVTDLGGLVYLGRADDQFKLNGVRLEIGEIEAALLRHPEVSAAAVRLWPDEDGGRRPVGYVVCPPSLPLGDVRAAAAEVLAPGGALARIVRIDAMPLNVSGKLDRASLPEPIDSLSIHQVAMHRSRVGEVVDAVWAKVLGLRPTGMDADFFTLGGHSLKAVAVVSHLNRALGTTLSATDLFRFPILGAYICEVERALERSSGVVRVLPRVVGSGVWHGLSESQRRLWLISKTDGGRRVYWQTCALRIDGELNEVALAAAFQQLQQAHGALRTIFRTVAGEPEQCVLPDPCCEMEICQVESAIDTLNELTAEGLSLSQRPPVRFVYLRESSAVSVCALITHHMLIDEWSLAVLADDLARFYSAALRGTAEQRLVRPLDFIDFVADEIGRPVNERRKRHLEYWARQLSALGSTRLSFDRNNGQTRHFNGGHYEGEISVPLREHLERIAGARAVTPFVALLAGFFVLLQRYGVGDDLCLGVMDSGRAHYEMERVVGLFARPLPIRLRMDEGEPLEALLRRLQTTLLDASMHADVPLDKIERRVDPRSPHGGYPLFNILIVMQNMTGGAYTFGDLSARPVVVNSGIAEFDLVVEIFARDGGFGLRFAYDSDIYEADRIVDLASRLKRVLLQIADDPARLLADVNLLDEQEIEALKREFSGGAP